MFVLSFVFGTFAAVFFCFRFHSLFCSTKIVCETLCKFLYFYANLKCTFMQSIMVNRKLFENFEFSAHLQKHSIFLLYISLLFLLFWIIYRKRKQKRKSRFLWCFCPKMSLFVANNVLIFRDLHLYRANHTPPPRFWHSQSGSALFRFFYFFIFYFFCKIL